ncbi:MAG TPA: ribosome silencing factor [Myxococcota bacterium]|nr:ribosome silencing factor [Myxococcota bacterium]HRY96759.1 ribosome silencing factor [Myxococcota bacterium]
MGAEKKARRPRLLHVGPLTSYTDYLLLLSATSDRHARALADFLASEIKRTARVRALGVEGVEGGQWILLDFGDVVVHVMQETTRKYYDLDGLWVDAEEVALADS